MSFDKPKEGNTKRKNSTEIAPGLKEVEPSKSDSKSSEINVYHGKSSKSDKVNQTETTTSRSFIIPQKSDTPGENKKKDAPKNPANNNPEKPLIKVVQTFTTETKNLMSNDRKDDRSTEPRKHHLYDTKCSKKAKTGIELERMKLQAELKATEEIAKLKQTIIEKRLALELATIQNKVEHPSVTHCSSSHIELRALEDLVKKKQNIVETNLAQELQKIDDQTRGQSARRPSTPPSPSQKSSPPPSPIKCSNPFRTESTSSMLTNLRGLTILEKKFASEKPYTLKPSPVNITFENRLADSRQKQLDWYQKYYNQQAESNSMYPGPPGVPYNRGHSAWKSAMAKIKKKIRNKNVDPWEQ